MVTRTQCLYRGRIIGIETIYTVIDGKQINIPEKLADLRRKSRDGELFCPCGCGSNLILVAGEQNLREQHFRIRADGEAANCTYVSEGEVSVNSKVILKCWLDDKLGDADTASRVPVSDVDDTERRYEFTFLSLSRGVGVNYSHKKENVTDGKLDALERNGRGVHLIHVVDISNLNESGQFPESLAKIQERQGYCLFLEPCENDYFRSSMTAAAYRRNIDGLWEQIIIATDPVSRFDIGESGEPVHEGSSLHDIAEEKIRQFEACQEELREQREVLKAEAERERKLREAEKAEERRKREEALRQEAERLRKLEEEKRIRKEEKEAGEKREREEFFRNLPMMQFGKMKTVSDPDGNRLYKCTYCGRIGHEEEFYTYQGSEGICYDCDRNSTKLKEEREAQARELERQREAVPKVSRDPRTCPECGRRLVERNGRNGTFIGCTGFPKCRYTRSRW